jgi:hypothetical protein
MIWKITASELEKLDPREQATVLREMISDYQKATGCRWSHAALVVKKRFPAARQYFGAPDKLPV